MIYLNQAPDFTCPATAFYIHRELGLGSSCAIFDITHGCVAFVYGLFLAHTMICSGQFKKILVLTADINSRKNLKDRNNAPLFGDAGCCALVEKSYKSKQAFFNLETFSDDYESIIVPYSSTKKIIKDGYANLHENIENIKKLYESEPINLLDPYMDGGKVFEFTTQVVPEAIKKLLNYSKKSNNDIKRLCIHQANSQIVKEVARLSGFSDDKASSESFEKYGNNTTSSVASIINSSYVEFIREETGNYLLSSFGNGLSYINAIVEFSKDMYLSGMKEMDILPKNTRDGYYSYWLSKYNILNNKGEN